jgi:hypothetical protein
MLSVFSKRFRIKAAIAATVLYAVCVLAPSAALAFGDRDATAHCLTDVPVAAHVHQPQPAAHNHDSADGTAHEHSDSSTPQKHSDADGKNHAGNCCGLFCVTALAHEPALALSAPPTAALSGPGGDYELAGRGPDRINRPPIG